MTSLIDRYIAATNDSFPGGDQAEVEREVRAALEDIVEAKMAKGLGREQAEIAAIEEVGEPAKFASQFRQKQRYLIGPDIFGAWWKTLTTVLMVAVPIVIAISIFEMLGGAGDSYGEAFASAIGSGFSFGVQIVFWVTFAFAMIELTGTSSHVEGAMHSAKDWNVDDLPELKSGRQIGHWELAFQLVTLGLFVWFVGRLATDRLGALGLAHWLDLPADIPVFSPALSVVWLWVLIGIVVVNVLVALWSYAVGYWTQTITLATVLINGAWIAFIIAVSSTGEIINPEIRELKPELGTWSIVGENSNRIIVTIVILVSVWDIFESVKGHLAYRRQMSLR